MDLNAASGSQLGSQSDFPAEPFSEFLWTCCICGTFQVVALVQSCIQCGHQYHLCCSVELLPVEPPAVSLTRESIPDLFERNVVEHNSPTHNSSERAVDISSISKGKQLAPCLTSAPGSKSARDNSSRLTVNRSDSPTKSQNRTHRVRFQLPARSDVLPNGTCSGPDPEIEAMSSTCPIALESIQIKRPAMKQSFYQSTEVKSVPDALRKLVISVRDLVTNSASRGNRDSPKWKRERSVSSSSKSNPRNWSEGCTSRSRSSLSDSDTSCESDSEDDRGPNKRLKCENSVQKLEKLFACNYYARDPKSCMDRKKKKTYTAGFETPARLKAHLYKHHRLRRCRACHEEFETYDLLSEHRTQQGSCKSQSHGEIDSIEGFDESQESELRVRKGFKTLTPLEVWHDIDMILFPKTDRRCRPSAYMSRNSWPQSFDCKHDILDMLESIQDPCQQALTDYLTEKVGEVLAQEKASPLLDARIKEKLADSIKSAQEKLFSLLRHDLLDPLDQPGQKTEEGGEKPLEEVPKLATQHYAEASGTPVDSYRFDGSMYDFATSLNPETGGFPDLSEIWSTNEEDWNTFLTLYTANLEQSSQGQPDASSQTDDSIPKLYEQGENDRGIYLQQEINARFEGLGENVSGDLTALLEQAIETGEDRWDSLHVSG